MGFDITKYFGAGNVARPSDEPGAAVRKRESYNSKKKAYVRNIGTNNGLGITRADTDVGSVVGKILAIDKNQPYEGICAQICDAYFNWGYTQQEIADAVGWSQSKISNIVNGR